MGKVWLCYWLKANSDAGSFVFLGGLESVHSTADDVIEWRQEYYSILGTVLKCLLVFLRIHVLSLLSVTQSR